MIAKDTVYKLCALWAISIMGCLVAMPFVAFYFSFHGFWFYAGLVFTYTMIGLLVFTTWSTRPDIAEDLES